ncbi:class I adenylate-forming enzyme family protein [Devosia sp.]|uniref:class I adenylate-forming enzyme family protein n=1 Tax=Devosia sp. TaxID=1871048 RepID=UPI003BA89509
MTSNFAFAALQRAYSQPDATAFSAERKVSYQRFADLTVNFARRLEALGVGRDATVALAIQDLPLAIAAVTAVGLLGARWVQLADIAPATFPGTTHVLTSGAGAERPGGIAIDPNWLDAGVSTEAALTGFAGAATPDATWMIAHSSGTTGKLKYMPLSYEAVGRRIANPELQDGAPPTTLTLFSPLSYIGAKIGTGNLVLGGTNAQWAPWEQLLAGGVNRIMGSPAQFTSAIFSRTAPPARKIRSAKVTGAAVTQKFVETALRYFDELYVLYGATEVGTTTLAVYTDAAQYNGSAGHPYEGAVVEILDADGRPCPAGTEGMVRVKTDWAVPGYIGEPELTAAYFQDGWFHPGDLGTLDSTGALTITGRTGDVINAGGRKLNAAELDEIIQAHSEVQDGYCFIDRDQFGADVLAVVLALTPTANPSCLAEIRDAAIAKLGKSKSPQRFYIAAKVPRNENGKPMRREAAAGVGGYVLIEV